MSQLSLFLHSINRIQLDKLQSSQAVDPDLLKKHISIEQEEIKSFVGIKRINYKFEKKNIHLKYILERDGEYKDNNRVIKKFIAHIWISHELFLKIFYHLKFLLDSRSKNDVNANILITDNKIGGLLRYLTVLTQEYDHYISSYEIQKIILNGGNGVLPAWDINYPDPNHIYPFIDNLFYFHEQSSILCGRSDT